MLTVFFIIWLIQAVAFGGLVAACVVEFIRHKEWWGAQFGTLVLAAFFKLDKMIFDYMDFSSLFN